MSTTSEAAIVLAAVAKHFKKTKRREYTTLKTELVRLLKGEAKPVEPEKEEFIEALKHVDLTIPQGKTVGIIGRNGSGKSTLLKLITGIYTPTVGTVKVHGRISALLDLGAGFHPDFTGRENILINGIILGMTRAQAKAKAPEIIEFAEIGDFIDEPVRTYSSGMFMRLAFAVATHVDPDILIIDEILAVGDEHFTHKSIARMNAFKASGKTIVLVTHDLATVQNWCDHAVWIDGGRVREEGDPARVVDAYRRAVAAAEKGPLQDSALRAPGLELPSVPAAPEPPVRLTAVNARPAQSRLEVVVEFEVAQPTSFELVVHVNDEKARVLFASTLPVSVQALGAARARLSIEHQSFAAGKYLVAAQAFPSAPYAAQRIEMLFDISAGVGPAATASHSNWTLEPPTA